MKRCFAIPLLALPPCAAGFAQPQPRRPRSAVPLTEENMPPLMQPREEPARAETAVAPPTDGLPEERAPAPERHETPARRAEESSFWQALMRAFSPWPI